MKRYKETSYTIIVKTDQFSDTPFGNHLPLMIYGSDYRQLINQSLDELLELSPKDWEGLGLNLNVSIGKVSYESNVNVTAEKLAEQAGKTYKDAAEFKTAAIEWLSSQGITPDSPYYRLQMNTRTELACDIMKELEKGGLDE